MGTGQKKTWEERTKAEGGGPERQGKRERGREIRKEEKQKKIYDMTRCIYSSLDALPGYCTVQINGTNHGELEQL